MERIVTGLLAAIAIFWAGACLALGSGSVPEWWLPGALALGLLLAAAASRRTRFGESAQPAPRWANAAAWIVLGTATAILLHGALATSSRHWDGAASFDAKVYWLANAPTLQQPFFAQEGVFHHSPDYPLLQPLLVAMTERLAPELGRVVLPMLYLLLCGVLTSILNRRGVQPLLRLATVTAVGVTPALLNAHGGAADSGYSDCLLLVATTTLAGSLLNRQTLWFALGTVMLVAAKPEGTPYAILGLLVAFAHGHRKLLWSGCAAFLMSGIIWEPVRAQLLHRPTPNLLPPLHLAVTTALLLANEACRALRLQARSRWLLALALPAVALLTAPFVAQTQQTDGGAMSLYIRRLDSFYSGLSNLPAYAAGVFEFGVVRLRLGLTLVLPLAIGGTLFWRRSRAAAHLANARRTNGPQADGPRLLLAFTLLGLAATALPFVLSPEANIEHHVRSSVVRLLLHWVGPLWLLSACWLAAILASAEPDPNEARSDVANS